MTQQEESAVIVTEMINKINIDFKPYRKEITKRHLLSIWLIISSTLLLYMVQ